MGDPIDPDKLVEVARLAGDFGYHPGYFSRLAKDGKLKAWRFGKTWVTTREIAERYIQTTPKPGRPKAKLRKVKRAK